MEDLSENIRQKFDTSLPTVSLEAMMMACAINAKESRYIAVTNIPGAFLDADMEEEVHILLEGAITELIIRLDPKLYSKYLWRNMNDKQMLYVKLKIFVKAHKTRNTMVVAFLCTRVQAPDEYDYKKLTMVMHCTKELTLMIEPRDSTQWWVDSSYMVHPDMHSQSGIIMMLGKGVIYSMSCKQKINRKSLIEAELVAIDNAMGQVLWTRLFAILLCDRKDKNSEVKVAYCPTSNMLADFYTKLSFIHMCEMILNLPSSTSTAMHRSVLDNKNKNNETKRNYKAVQSQKQNGSEGLGSSSVTGRKVSWARGTKTSLTGPKNVKSMEFKYK